MGNEMEEPLGLRRRGLPNVPARDREKPSDVQAQAMADIATKMNKTAREQGIDAEKVDEHRKKTLSTFSTNELEKTIRALPKPEIQRDPSFAAALAEEYAARMIQEERDHAERE